MTRHAAAFAMALLATTGVAAASELGSGYSIHFDRFKGAVYYTVEQEGYRVVATIAEGGKAWPYVSLRP